MGRVLSRAVRGSGSLLLSFWLCRVPLSAGGQGAGELAWMGVCYVGPQST
jgi:hypothetical protein